MQGHNHVRHTQITKNDDPMGGLCDALGAEGTMGHLCGSLGIPWNCKLAKDDFKHKTSKLDQAFLNK